MFLASIIWLKLVSFAHTNYDIRMLSKSIEKVKHRYMLVCFIFHGFCYNR
jgi:hypothetical protein